MRLVALAVVVLCVLGVAFAAPQVATDESLLPGEFGDDDADTPEYGPVESSYFRAMSYDRYTGTGWQRTGRPEPVSSLETPPGSTDRVTVEYEVQEPVRTLPAPWRPLEYDGPDAASVEGSLEPTTTLEPGDEFTVTSRRPVWTEAELRSAGTDYPAEIEERYTQLPEEERAGLGELSAEITADAETPYEKSVAVNRWLRTEKNYSLTVDRPDGAFATTFATEMDAGYCQYFATTMVAMLRAEGVPARYVTGYTPYEQVGAGEHVIRGKYAHAWTEVYFPEVGWVPFDPTPPSEREAARGLATAEAELDGGSQAALRGEFDRLSRAGTEAEDGWQRIAADIDIEGERVPGNDVTVRVTDPASGEALSGVQVRFNGRPIGETDEAGGVAAMIPYASSLTVSTHVYESDGEPPPVLDDEGATGSGPTADSIQDLRYATPETEIAGTLAGLSDVVLFRATVEEGAILRRGEPSEEVSDTNGDPQQASIPQPTERFSVDESFAGEEIFLLNTSIDVALSPSDESRPGEPLSVTATIEGQPVADATVTAGEETATTDSNGEATILTPYEQPAEIVVERDEARGNETIPVRGQLRLELDGDRVAGSMWMIRATIDGAPVPEATVTNGVETTTTDADGTARIPVPYSHPGTISVERGDFSTSVNASTEPSDTGVSVDGTTPGAATDLRAWVEGDVPMRNAAIELDGDSIGTTDDVGTGTVRLPYEDSVTVTVERGDARAQTVVYISTAMRVEIDGRAMPGRTANIHATVDGEPVENGTVFVNGEEAARTDTSGEASIAVPLFATAADIRVERGAAAGSTDAGPLWLYWAMLLGGLTVTVVGARQLGYVESLPRSPGAAFEALLSAAWALVAALRADAEKTLATRDAGAETSAESTDDRPDEPEFLLEPATNNEVYRAWASLVAGLEETPRTPAEAAETAIERGLPEEAVTELTDLFREVRYSDAEPTAEREQRAASALEAIREAT